MDFQTLKDKAKKMNVTINDLLMGVCSVALKEYLEVRGDTKSEFITLGVPFSLRDPIIKKIDFKFQNDLVLIPFKLHLMNTLQDALAMHKKNMDEIKKSLLPVGMYFSRRLVNFMCT
mmetsp:Transcript_28914/g.27846  ORF Transcript_28914/g.27846 Transcript_28914/m.27846 type:complete len:117 (-) Transcript_28914:208-558(-)|eukprot:CAMPEP_0170552004 /NCGR_PEP_ID=MMETSP0211-20121228/9984_1 /TAXON_ID=311385 /ORGANISM="Pseudokeronopsis sp., Strain OXSARD2" /LENGTH=116 /DNA_ID=CAMNT_0010859519 /DNA_START=716 /DNA_END=1066 /DNA_ORIENTATION=+